MGGGQGAVREGGGASLIPVESLKEQRYKYNGAVIGPFLTQPPTLFLFPPRPLTKYCGEKSGSMEWNYFICLRCFIVCFGFSPSSSGEDISRG